MSVYPRMRIFVVTAALILVALLAFSFLFPLPVSLLLRGMFRNGVAVAPDNYAAIKQQVTVVQDAIYTSDYRDNSADIYFPKNADESYPVVLWVHGGAFVGGDKQDVALYATALAQSGFAVVCMNYQRAPEAKYPVPVIQVGEVYRWLCDIAAQYPLDMTSLTLAGDSAGAHIVAQFAVVQCNQVYADELAMAQIVPRSALKSVLLFCGPFDVEKIGTSSHPLINFFMNRAAWSYFGSKNWAEKFSSQATIANYITADFPPTFLSDGNTGSFEVHARDLAEVLQKHNVPVETYFTSSKNEETPHEYQFIMNTPAGKESFQKVLVFLKQYAH